MTHTRIEVPLDQLVAGEDNPRRTPASAHTRAMLHASIGALAAREDGPCDGLIHPLTVQRCDADRYRVRIGNTRLEVLRELAADPQSAVGVDQPIRCELVEHWEPHLALAENLAREQLRLVDVHDALDALYRDGWEKDEATRTLGLCPEQLEAYELIGRLHPDLREAARGGKLDDARVRAYAGCEDPERQRRHFECYPTGVSADEVRRALRGRVLPGDHPWVRLVGAEEYERRGGK